MNLSMTVDARLVADLTSKITALEAEIAALKAQPVQPVDMVLHCPQCHHQHVDAPDWCPVPSRTEFASLKWDNPPHRSHLCHACGCIWRPADVPTNGVAAIKTKGANDSAPVQPVKQDDYTRGFGDGWATGMKDAKP